MTPGQFLNVVVTMRNTGNTTWTAADGFSLQVLADDCAMLPGSSIQLFPADSVPPFSNFDFLTTLTAPPTPGTCSVQFRMAQNAAPFGGIVVKSVIIASPPNVVKDWKLYE